MTRIAERLALLVCLAVPGCHSSNEEASEAPTATAKKNRATGASGEAGGVYCSVESKTSCYDLDLDASKVTLMMGQTRGKSYALERRGDDRYGFSITPDHEVTIRIADPDTLEVQNTGGGSWITLKRKR